MHRRRCAIKGLYCINILKFFSVILCIGILFSCQYRKAKEFDILLDLTEQKVQHILADSIEQKRLEALVDQKPDVALFITEKQTKDLTTLIEKIDEQDVSDIPDANLLKDMVADYYKELRRMKELDVLDAQLMALTLQSDTAKATKAQMEITKLRGKRLELHRIIGERDRAKHKAKTKFEQANNI